MSAIRVSERSLKLPAKYLLPTDSGRQGGLIRIAGQRVHRADSLGAWRH